LFEVLVELLYRIVYWKLVVMSVVNVLSSWMQKKTTSTDANETIVVSMYGMAVSFLVVELSLSPLLGISGAHDSAVTLLVQAVL
jgi:hypothetical protein